MALALGVLKFNGGHRGAEVLRAYQSLHEDEQWPEDVGLIERHKFGRISIHGPISSDAVWDDEESAEPLAGLGFGGMTGALVGAIAGPAGMAVGGSIGSAFGGLLGAASESDKQSIYDVVRGKLDKDTSATVLLGDEQEVDQMLEALRPGAVDEVRRTLPEAMRGQLEQAIREAVREGREVVQDSPA